MRLYFLTMQSTNCKQFIILNNRSNKEQEANHKVNTNLSYGFLKNTIVALFFSNSDREDIMEQLKILFKQELVPIRPNRSYERNTRK